MYRARCLEKHNLVIDHAKKENYNDSWPTNSHDGSNVKKDNSPANRCENVW